MVTCILDVGVACLEPAKGGIGITQFTRPKSKLKLACLWLQVGEDGDLEKEHFTRSPALLCWWVVFSLVGFGFLDQGW